MKRDAHAKRARVDGGLSWLWTYRAYVGALAALVLVAVVVPGTRDAGPAVSSLAGHENRTAPVHAIAEETAAAAPEAVTGAAAPVTVAGVGEVAEAVPALAAEALDAPDCDPATGRIAIPSFYAPNCVPLWPRGADNGGETWSGVTGETITVAVYMGEVNEQTAAILDTAGAGSDTTPEEDWENRLKMVEAYQAHFETYGRRVELVGVEASGPGDDDAAARADAIKVASEIGAFASFGAPGDTDAYVDELSARGVMCFSCTVSRPNEKYEGWAPYVWSDLMSSTKGYIHRAEYVGKRLAGRPAVHAGDAAMHDQQRRFGLVYFETADGAYRQGVEFFEHELAKYGVELADTIAVTGAHLNPTAAQNEARTVAARIADRGITSVIFAGDPLYPIFLTQELSRQGYFPEWIISGSALTDSTFFARLYDPAQWENAFGVSFLTARVAPEVSEGEPNLFEWHYGHELTSYPSALPMDTLFRGLHMAGPILHPGTLRDGLFSWRPTSGFITRFGVSYGTQRWPFPDYTAADDTTEIWWDRSVSGPDELGNSGTGMYRYVDGGRRYLPGEWPTGPPRAFDRTDTVTLYDHRPPQDVAPSYPAREGLRG